MIRKLLPLVLALIGLGAGAGAGLFLRPAPDPDPAAEEVAAPVDPALVPDYVKLSNQFVVPLVEKDRITAMVILTLSLEVKQGTSEQVYAREPKLRDAFLQLLFDHANTGGFRGSFTDAANLVILREGLREIAQKLLGDSVTDVLITDIVRQDS
ncbi:MAG: flagellar basal body-associated FliL family protein [Rhodobacteraceae bacterium]|nr:flagellar basal body-associated FliL family protein [Paracoccaceae bacterium]MCF8515702.1 flagellar basal body-associated FliL family protein [Paracoccaceae bacterium]MCF8519947.1 flagellar basal body-associated FliL family protein [Paracoccaceae bacterium]